MEWLTLVGLALNLVGALMIAGADSSVGKLVDISLLAIEGKLAVIRKALRKGDPPQDPFPEMDGVATLVRCSRLTFWAPQ
jgi:hypothetical protein